MNRYRFDEKNHVHLLDNKPLIGTSTIAGSVGKGSALTWWASGKACETLGWIKKEYAPEDKYKNNCINEKERLDAARNSLEDLRFYTPEIWLETLDKSYKAHSKELKRTADKGVDLHAELERYVKFQISGKLETPPLELLENEEIKKIIQPFVQWAEKNVKKWLFSEVHVYSEELWTGGIIDAGYIDNNDEFVLADFKSGGAWLSGYYQIGGYHIQLNENKKAFDENGNVAFELNDLKVKKHAIFPFKGGFTEPKIRTNIIDDCEGFRCATKLYKLNADFEKSNSL